MGLFDALVSGSGSSDTPASPPPINPLALDTIKQFEGFSPQAQWDYKQWSGGYGTKAQPGQTYTPESAHAELIRAATPINSWIASNITAPLTTQQHAGLMSFGYNLGTGKGGLSDLTDDINRGDWQSVADRMQSYNHAGGEVNAGLTNRRAKEGALVLGQNPMSNDANTNATLAAFGQPSALPPAAGASLAQVLAARLAGTPGAPTATDDAALTPPDERLRSLGNALSNAAIEQPAHGWGDAVRGLAGMLAGNLYGSAYRGQQQAYEGALGSKLASALGDPRAVAQVALKSGDPTTLQAVMANALSPKEAPNLVNVGSDQYGSPVMKMRNPIDGKLFELDGKTPYAPSATTNVLGGPGQPTSTLATDANGKMVTGDAFLSTLPQDRAQQVRNMAAGATPFPTGSYAKSPQAQHLLQDVQQYDPNFSEQTSKARSAYMKDYASGPLSRNITNLNAAVAHSADLHDMVDSLHNSSIPLLGQPFNYIKNQPYINTGDAAANFLAKRDAVANEWKRYFGGIGGGTEAEVQRQLDVLGSSKSPDQLKGAIQTLIKSGQEKAAELETSRANVMGDHYKGPPIISPSAQARLAKVLPSDALPGAPPQAVQATAETPSGPAPAADPLGKARDAIAKGAPRDSVIQRLKAAGYDTTGL